MPQDTATKQDNSNGKVEALSVQKRTEQENQIASIPSLFWFTRKDDGSEISAWWSPQRDFELREFWRRTGNDILQGAISSMVKKFKSLNYTIEGPQRVINRFSPILANAEFGVGWGLFLTKLLTDYLTQDKGAFWENIGAGNPNGPISGPVLGIAHLDSQFCQLTGDPTFPVVFHNAKNSQSHKLHASRVVHVVDMASPNELFNNVGFCAVSRTIASSQVLLKLAKYKNEKLDDLPEAGMLLMNNILPNQFDDTKASYARERRRLGQEIWTSVMTLFGLDPAQPATAELISFANLPDAFNEQESTDIYAKIVALAFGVDVREFWPLSAGSLGTATESQVQAQKAKGKGVGELISAIERAINWKVLPESIEFKFDFQDDDEDKLRAEIDQVKVNTIMSMWRPDIANVSPVTSLEIRQMLADNVDYFSEDFLLEDITDEATLTDTEQEGDSKLFGPRVIVDNKGNVRPIQKRFRHQVTDAMKMALDNYRQKKITSEQIAEYALAELSNE
jgi:hypothetical protein